MVYREQDPEYLTRRTPEVAGGFTGLEPYIVLGIAYLAMGLVSGISIFVDQSPVSSNIISFVVELIAEVIPGIWRES